MILRVSVRDAVTLAAHDIELTAEPDSSVASLLASLPFQVGDRRCYVGAEPLDPDASLADSPLVAGADDQHRGTRAAPADPCRGGGGLRVVSGPDAGLVTWVTPGAHLLGRDPTAAVWLRDLDVSRRHARVDVSPSGAVTVTDLGSSNGTFVDGVATTGPVSLAAAGALEVGGDRLRWMPLPGAPLQTRRSRDGRLEFDRAFAPAPAITRAEVVLPDPVAAPSRNLLTLLVPSLAPLLLTFALSMGFKEPLWLVGGLVGPIVALVPYLADRRRRAAALRAFIEAREAAERTLAEHVATEERVRRELAPDVSDLTWAAIGAGRELWPRNADSPHGLVLRVGTADEPAAVDLRGEPWPGFTPPVLRDVPVTVDLRATGVLGVVGPPEHVRTTLRWLLVQLGTLRSPEDLRLVVITSTDGNELAWTGWPPHVDAGEDGPSPCWIGNTRETRSARVTELKELVAVRMAHRRAGEAWLGQETVAVLDGALALRHLPGMKEVLRDGPSVGVYVVCADRHDMNECRGLCELDETGTLRLTRSREEYPRTVRPDRVERATAERIARAVAPMRDRLTLAGGPAAIPYPVRYLDLLGIGSPTAEDVLTRWGEQPGPTTGVSLGADGSGAVAVDLAVQGPHTMLGGATGTGKSVLLQTLVTALLLANRPDELNLVLVDFKGGSAFLPFESCPHVVALIRSTGETPADVFDEAAATRVLASVRAEVRRRESLLARYGGEIDEYWRDRRKNSALSALPRLVMIFDEYARVLEVSPDFLKELVNVAAKGRSLGMHLVLATQSLQGKLSAELKNNIELRISLRQNEPADSTEVLGAPDAALIPGRLRGRGMILSTKDETRTPRAFQSGYLGNPPPVGGPPPARVRIVEWPALGAPRPDERVDHGDAPTDQDLALAAVREATRRLGVPAPFRPLLPPLPAALTLEDLTRQASAELPDTAVPFGLADQPAAQAQPAAVLDLAGTDRLLVAGGPQSGRTTFARALISSLAARFRADRAHLYVIESQPAGLAAYAGLPHCGGVFSPAEPDRIRRLVTWLDGEVQRRTAARFGAPTEPEPWVVVVIDGWEYFENRSDPNFAETSLLGTLREIISAGAPVGVHVVPIGGQDMMAGKVPALYSKRLLLPFPKEDTRRQHLPSGVVSPPVLPGRAVDAGTGTHVQVCRPPVSAEDLVARGGADAGNARADVGVGRLPRGFPSMPTRVTADALRVSEPAASATWIPFGIGGPVVDTVGIDLFDAGPHLMLVSGPPGSGRTTVAATLAHGLRRIGVGLLAVAPPRSPLPRLLPQDAGVRVVTGTSLKDADLRDAVDAFGDGPYAVVVDDCEQITLAATQESFTELPNLLQDIASPGALGRHALVLAADALPILSGQRRSLMRVVSEIMTAGTRLLLTPTSRPAAREHGFTLEPDQFFAGPPGRGYLTVAREAFLVHVAVQDAADVTSGEP